MSGEYQGYIADFLHRRKLQDRDGFSMRAAKALERLSAWTPEQIAKELARVRTGLFLESNSVAKGDVLGELAGRLADRCTGPRGAARRKHTVLFVSANPGTTQALAIDEEARAIDQKIRASQHRDRLTFATAWAARPDDLLQKLNEHEADIVQFSGHGAGMSGLVFVADDGSGKPVSAEALGALFKNRGGSTKVVFLNACDSMEQARAIAEHIDCAIGMTDSISDEAARVFAASFYRAVGFGKSVAVAFDEARTALLLESIDEDDVPALVTRDGVNASNVVVVPD